MGNYALAGFLILVGLLFMGLAIPEIIIGVVALVAGILVLIGR